MKRLNSCALLVFSLALPLSAQADLPCNADEAATYLGATRWTNGNADTRVPLDRIYSVEDTVDLASATGKLVFGRLPESFVGDGNPQRVLVFLSHAGLDDGNCPGSLLAPFTGPGRIVFKGTTLPAYLTSWRCTEKARPTNHRKIKVWAYYFDRPVSCFHRD